MKHWKTGPGKEHYSNDLWQDIVALLGQDFTKINMQNQLNGMRDMLTVVVLTTELPECHNQCTLLHLYMQQYNMHVSSLSLDLDSGKPNFHSKLRLSLCG